MRAEFATIQMRFELETDIKWLPTNTHIAHRKGMRVEFASCAIWVRKQMADPTVF